MNIFYKHIILLGISLSCVALSAQSTIEREVVAAAGQSSSNNSMLLEWTLGECVIDQGSNNRLILTQGFHQPLYETLIKLHSISGFIWADNTSFSNGIVHLYQLNKDDIYINIDNVNIRNDGSFNFSSLSDGSYKVGVLPLDEQYIETFYPQVDTISKAFSFNINSPVGSIDINLLEQPEKPTNPDTPIPIEYLIDSYPNPATNQITVQRTSEDQTQELVIELYNLYGHRLITDVLIENEAQSEKAEITIDISSLPKGVYILKTTEAYYERSRLIIKQ